MIHKAVQVHSIKRNVSGCAVPDDQIELIDGMQTTVSTTSSTPF